MSRTWSVKARLMASALVAALGVATLAGFNVYSGRVNSRALERVHKSFAKPLERLMPLKESEARRIYDEAAAANIRLNQSSVLLATAVTAMIGCLLFLMSRSLSRQLGGEPAYAAGIVRTIAGGDLT